MELVLSRQLKNYHLRAWSSAMFTSVFRAQAPARGSSVRSHVTLDLKTFLLLPRRYQAGKLRFHQASLWTHLSTLEAPWQMQQHLENFETFTVYLDFTIFCVFIALPDWCCGLFSFCYASIFIYDDANNGSADN